MLLLQLEMPLEPGEAEGVLCDMQRATQKAQESPEPDWTGGSPRHLLAVSFEAVRWSVLTPSACNES